MTKEIMDFYENVKPDEKARKRMLQNIQTMAAKEYESREGENSVKNTFFTRKFVSAHTCHKFVMPQRTCAEMRINMRLKSKRMVRIAVVAAVALGVPAMTYAAGIFNLHDVNVGKIKVEDFEKKQEKEVDMISLQGMADSPEAKASKEWRAYVKKEGADAIDLPEEKDYPEGLDEYADIYGCYSKEMLDKLDEICKKYNLSKLSGFKIVNNEKELCREVGIGNIYRTGKKDIENTPLCGYCYSDGTFHFEGTAVVGKNEDVGYQFMRHIKGSFTNGGLTVGNLGDYRQWEYVTENGQTVLLANSGYKGLIMCETEKSFITVNVLAELSNKELELLTESFDFSVIP